MSTFVQHEMLDAEVFPPGAGLDWYGVAPASNCAAHWTVSRFVANVLACDFFPRGLTCARYFPPT